MKNFFIQNKKLVLLCVLGAAGLLIADRLLPNNYQNILGIDRRLFILIFSGLLLALIPFSFLLVKFASPETRERWAKEYEEDKERRSKRSIRPKQWVALIIFFIFLWGIGEAVEWHPFYTVPVGLYFGGALVIFIFRMPFAILNSFREKRAAVVAKEAARAEEKKQREAYEERQENAKKEPLLIGPAEAPPGELALGWLLEQNKETLRHTAELKTADRVDREAHFYVVGASGMGKTKLLEALILQDAKRGQGFGVIDPHGDLIEDIKVHLTFNPGPKDKQDAEQRIKFLMERVVLVDPTDRDQTACFNPLEMYPGVPAAELAGEMVMIFKKIWADSWGPRLEDLMRASFIALAETGGTICDLPRFLTDDDFRRKITPRVKNQIAVNSLKHFESESQGSKNNAIGPVLNKVNALLTDDRLYQLFSSRKSTFNLREIIDSGKILLVKLDKGRLKGSADLLGSLLVSKIQMAAFARTDTPQNKRRPFYLYIDEFQNFATEHFLETLAEARKYRLHLILAHQNLSQLPERLQAAILTNSGVQMYFRTSHQDAHILARESSEQPAQLSGFDKMVGETNPLHNNKRYDLEGQRWSDREQMIKDLPPRYFILKNKRESGAVLVKTDRIPDPLAADEETAQQSRELSNSFVGGLYLRKRSELARARVEAGEREDPEEPATFRERKA